MAPQIRGSSVPAAPRIPLRSMRATRQNLILGRKAGRKATRWGFGDAYRLFPRLEEMAATPAGVISGGEQQMLTICRTLMGDPDLIMID
jgi:branched-chain amino acid transport system ATP-binding protein